MRTALELLGVAGALLSVFLLGVLLSGDAALCGRFRSLDTSPDGVVMLSFCGDGLLGADGAAGRESTICDAAITGLAGGTGVVAGRDAGAETAMSGTAGFSWQVERGRRTRRVDPQADQARRESLAQKLTLDTVAPNMDVHTALFKDLLAFQFASPGMYGLDELWDGT